MTHNLRKRNFVRGIEHFVRAAVVERHRWRLSGRPRPNDDVAALREVDVANVCRAAVRGHALDDLLSHQRRRTHRVLTAG
jgi:hypothetical protein